MMIKFLIKDYGYLGGPSKETTNNFWVRDQTQGREGSFANCPSDVSHPLPQPESNGGSWASHLSQTLFFFLGSNGDWTQDREF